MHYIYKILIQTNQKKFNMCFCFHKIIEIINRKKKVEMVEYLNRFQLLICDDDDK